VLLFSNLEQTVMAVLSRAATYLEAVAQLKSIRRAADALRIAPSAVDRQIVQLERDVGMPLFERTAQGLRLTEAGTELVASVRRQRQIMLRARSQIDDLRGLRRGEVSIAIVEGASAFFTEALHEFHAKYPDVALKVRVDGSNSVVATVLSGDVDLALTFNPVTRSGLRTERSLVFQLGVAVPSLSPLAAAADISIADCVQHTLIVPAPSISLREVAETAWAKLLGYPLAFAFEVNSMNAMRTLVKAGLGIGLATQMDIAADETSGSVVFRPIREDGVPLSVLSLVCHSRRALPIPAFLLLNHLSHAMDNHPAPSV
jgi:DNA-binding transcriptional LysR family regulator